MSIPIKNPQFKNDLKGLSQLSHDGIVGVVDIVEAMHQRIYSLGGLLNQGDLNRTSGLTGFIYNTIRKTTQLSIRGIDLALATFKPKSPEPSSHQQRNQWVSILNGILGDHLASTDNPLAIEMTLVYQGQNVTPQQAAEICSKQPGHSLLLIHGLCMNDQLWQRDGHNHGTALQQSLALTPIYLRYNSGLAVYQNGQILAAILKEFFAALPTEKTCHLLCHSMGGLVLRSAIQTARLAQNSWPDKLGKLVFLGTPHHGAVLEKSGHLLDYIINISSFSAPFVKLTGVRSQGIKDLRHGCISQDKLFKTIDNQKNSFAIAASSKKPTQPIHQELIGDGLVSVSSALGKHKQIDCQLNLLPDHQITVKGVSHMGLLSDSQVFHHLLGIFKL